MNYIIFILLLCGSLVVKAGQFDQGVPCAGNYFERMPFEIFTTILNTTIDQATNHKEFYQTIATLSCINKKFYQSCSKPVVANGMMNWILAHSPSSTNSTDVDKNNTKIIYYAARNDMVTFIRCYYTAYPEKFKKLLQDEPNLLHGMRIWLSYNTLNWLLRQNIQKIDINTTDYHGCTVLHRAASKAKPHKQHGYNIVELLLAHGAAVNVRDNYPLKETPLHWAIESNHPSVIRLLINNGADSTIKNGVGHTVLGSICCGCHRTEVSPEVVSELRSGYRSSKPLHYMWSYLKSFFTDKW